MVHDSVTAILSGAELEDWQDQEILENYITKIDVSEELYVAFAKQTLTFEDITEIEYFKMYLDAFESDATITKYKSTQAFKKLSAEDQIKQLTIKFYQYAKALEFEKLFYFALTYTQNTVIITAPADNAKQKEFLGYDWSNRKGNEGIQIITPGGKMYCDADRKAEGTLASTVRKSFASEYLTLTEDNKLYVSIVPTVNTLDFSRVNFSKSIRTNFDTEATISSKYPLLPLKELCKQLSAGGDVPQGNWSKEKTAEFTIPIYSNGTSDNALYGYTNIPKIEDDAISISARGTIGYAAIRKAPFYPIVRLIIAVPDTSKVLLRYLLEILSQLDFRKSGKTIPQLTVPMIKDKKIPVPPIEIQKQIALKCEKIDEEYNSTRMSIEEYRSKIETLFDELESITKTSTSYKLSLSDKTSFAVSIGKRVLNSELVADGTIPVFSANVFEPFGFIDKLLVKDFSIDSVLWGIDGDWMVNFYPKDNPFYPTDHCGVLRVLTDKVHPRYMARILEIEGQKMNFSRSYRASIDRVEGISFSVPSFDVQEKAMKQVVELETKIAELERGLESLDGKKAEILASFLK